ncbi:MAG: hypothetical protein EHM39_03010, partial [Chloroflexi bacterium]
MKSKIGLVFTLFVVITFLLTGTVAAKQRGAKDKVTICHKGRTIRVSASALSAHLQHGDHRGTCERTSDDDRDDDDDDRDDDRDDDDEDRDEDRDDDRDEEIEYTEVMGTVVRYDPQFGVILLSDGTL